MLILLILCLTFISNTLAAENDPIFNNSKFFFILIHIHINRLGGCFKLIFSPFWIWWWHLQLLSPSIYISKILIFQFYCSNKDIRLRSLFYGKYSSWWNHTWPSKWYTLWYIQWIWYFFYFCSMHNGFRVLVLHDQLGYNSAILLCRGWVPTDRDHSRSNKCLYRFNKSRRFTNSFVSDHRRISSTVGRHRGMSLEGALERSL